MDYGRGHHKSARAFPEEGPPFEYTPENRERLEAICARYPADQRKSAILAALYLVQHQQGYITLNGMRHVAEVIGCTPADVEDVVSFYTMFYTRPMGRHVIQVCRNLSCSLLGARELVRHIEERIGARVGETTADGRYSLLTVECLGSCGTAPMMQVNDDYHENLTRERVDALLAEMK